MFELFAAAIVSCAGVPALSSPEPGIVFSSEGPGGLYVHERIVASNRSGEVRVRMMPTPSPQAPRAAIMASAPEHTTFMGMILIENGMRDSYRSRTLPDGLLARVNRLQDGETISFPVRHEVRLGGTTRNFVETHSITFLGCDVVQTGQGALRTRQYGVDTAGMRNGPRGLQVARTQKRVNISVEHGWVASYDYGDGARTMIRAGAAR